MCFIGVHSLSTNGSRCTLDASVTLTGRRTEADAVSPPLRPEAKEGSQMICRTFTSLRQEVGHSVNGCPLRPHNSIAV